MLPEMFCSANACACKPDTAVVNASKIPMTLPLQLDPQLDERRVTTGGPSPRTSQQAPCHLIYRFISMSYAGGPVCTPGPDMPTCRQILPSWTFGVLRPQAPRRLVTAKFAVF